MYRTNNYSWIFNHLSFVGLTLNFNNNATFQYKDARYPLNRFAGEEKYYQLVFFQNGKFS